MKKIILFLTVLLTPIYSIAAEKVLSDNDVAIYSAIFDLQADEKIAAAQKLEKDLENKILMNEVLYQRYISDTYRTKGAEIKSWMSKYYDTPGAVRMKKLAGIKKTSVRSVKMPSILYAESSEAAQSETWTVKRYTGSTNTKINQFKRAIRSGQTKVARLLLEDISFKKKLTKTDYGRLSGRLSYLYYTNGEYKLSRTWGKIASDAGSEYGLWAMGLLSYKEEKYADAQKYFSKILDLGQINDARKTEAGFWAGRAAAENDDMDTAKKYWKIAAVHQMSFYGALSSMMLGYVPYYQFFELETKDSDIAAIKENKYGTRALALLQIGETYLAEEYLKLMITRQASDKLIHAINTLSSEYELPRISIHVADVARQRGVFEIDNDILYTAQYPVPNWEPMGGWSIDRALLFAITKQESGFKTYAKSGAGANGLMQIMPGTAKLVARQNKIKMSEIDINNPEHNMFLGQQLIVDLLEHKNIDNNIIKMLASYNAGLGTVLKFEKNFETTDPLLYIESFPAYETRAYIKRVMANLWLYRRRLEQPLNTLDDLADGIWPLYSSEDEYVQQMIQSRQEI